MNISVQAIHFTADEKLIAHIHLKLKKFSTFSDTITHIEVFLKLDNVAHTIKDKLVEIKLRMPKHELFVKQASKSFEESFENCFDSMVNQIKKTKERS